MKKAQTFDGTRSNSPRAEPSQLNRLHTCRPFQVSAWKTDLPNARITIQHSLGLYMSFPAGHHNAMGLVAFGQECIRDLENEYATDDWSI